ncbi:MAG: Two-component response regulator [uncultured Sulfurovum sp.]|uniref:Two-component response regulator n=1 Tax=uncultured Sulfurovum sp. TaxID=269237 RepID=A0A6S6U329_9BACT|nr:MAG: Two-component response regulator [uncultured Sulfurovum sp.]
MMKKILLMEDDSDLAETLKELLELKDYEVRLVSNGVEASEASYQQKFDLYVFDINVPQFDGLELLEALRGANDRTETIFISAFIDLETISKAFKVGANDYLKKPFYPEELLIRIEAKFQTHEQTIRYNNLVYNPKNEVLLKEAKELHLSQMQRNLFQLFIHNINRIISKEEILEATEISSASAMRVAITKLKKSTDLNIKNVHGEGYRLETC